MEGSGLFSRVIDWLWASIVGLVGLIYMTDKARMRDQEKRIESIERELLSRPTDADVEKQREHIVELYRQHTSIRSEMASGFSSINASIHKMHIDLIEKINGKGVT